MKADDANEIGTALGPTQHLRALCESWEDIRKARMAAMQRGREDIAEDLRKMEDREGRNIKKGLMAQPIWPWLSQFPGLGGVHTARLIAAIGDPRRFPGQRCTEGHYFPPSRTLGQSCPVLPCGGTALAPRTTTGVRSVWHFAGLHAVDGKSPRKTKGHKADWSPTARTCVLQPDGIADQIVKQRVPKYRAIYDAQKERIARERGRVADGTEIDLASGSAATVRVNDQLDGGADDRGASDSASGLRPIQVHELARKIAAKAFVGDLIVEWKKVV